MNNLIVIMVSIAVVAIAIKSLRREAQRKRITEQRLGNLRRRREIERWNNDGE